MKLIQQPLKIIHRRQARGQYFDIVIGAVSLSGADTGRAYCSVELSLAPGIRIPRHTRKREEDSYYVPSGERQSAARNSHSQIKE